MGPQEMALISPISARSESLDYWRWDRCSSLVQVAKQLHEQGVEVEVVVGFATKEAVILEEELSQVAHVTVTTDDGTYGTKGLCFYGH